MADLGPDSLLVMAREAARKALSLNPDLGEAHAALGYIAHRFDWDTASARRHFERAVSISPSNVIALSDYGRFLLNFGDLEEAVSTLRLAAELDPATGFLASNLGRALYMAGRVEEAIPVLESALVLRSNSYTHLQLAYALFRAGRTEEALREAGVALTNAGQDSVFVMNGLAELSARAGDIDRARSLHARR